MRTSNVAKYRIGQYVQNMGANCVSGRIVSAVADVGTAGPGTLTIEAETTAAPDVLPLSESTSTDYDLTLVFPLQNNPKITYSEQDFVWGMLGLRATPETDPSFRPQGDNLFMHNASRILKTSRCFADDVA